MARFRSLLWPIIALVLVTGAFGVAYNYQRTLANILVSEGGNDNDPEDPGGRTSRGIIQTEWNGWRKTHPGLPSDVWRAPQSQIEAIYRQKYWDALNGDALPAGLDYTVVDYGVNSGIARSGRVLRQVLGLETRDWHVTQEVLDAIKKRAVTALIRQINQERHDFLHRLHTCPRFCGGWDRRVASVKVISLNMAGTPAPGSSLGHELPQNPLVKYTPLQPQLGPGLGGDTIPPPPHPELPIPTVPPPPPHRMTFWEWLWYGLSHIF